MNYNLIFANRTTAQLVDDRKILLHYECIDKVYHIEKELKRREEEENDAN